MLKKFAFPPILAALDDREKKIRGDIEASEKLKEDVEKIKIFSPSTLSLMKNLQQIGAAPIRIFNAGGLRKLILDYDKRFATEQGVYSTWELFYFSISI